MNESLQSLIEQSTIREEFFPAGCNGYPEIRCSFDKERFAELIVRECAAMFAREAETLRKCRRSTLDVAEKNRLAEGESAYEYAIELMQKRFNIKVSV